MKLKKGLESRLRELLYRIENSREPQKALSASELQELCYFVRILIT